MNSPTYALPEIVVLLFLLAVVLYVIDVTRKLKKEQRERELAETRIRRVCILVDGENMPHWTYQQIASFAAQIGPVAAARVYADWGVPANSSWRPEIRQYALEPISVVPYATGKNAVDITLALDAIEMLRDDIADIFIVASSDTDFLPLYRRIRRHGKAVIVFGLAHAPRIIAETANELIQTLAPTPRSTERCATLPDDDGKSAARELAGIDDHIQDLLRAYSKCRDSDGWAAMSSVGHALSDQNEYLKNHISEHGSLSRYIRSTGLFHIEQYDNRTRMKLTRDPRRATAGTVQRHPDGAA